MTTWNTKVKSLTAEAYHFAKPDPHRRTNNRCLYVKQQ